MAHAATPTGPLHDRLVGLRLTGDLATDSARLGAAGLTDGLLVHPPTPARVAEFLAAADPAEVRAGPIPLAMAPPTAWDMAACSVMAGCRPGDFGLVLAALEALTTPAFNLLGVQTTTSGVAPLLVLSGPADQVEPLMVGRAVRLILHSLGNALPGVTNLSTQGHPGKISWCVAESAESPWTPLHTDRGVGASRAVTAVAAVGSVEVILGQADPETDLDVLARAGAAVRAAGLAPGVARRQWLVLLPPETAQRFDALGWDRADLAGALVTRSAALLAQVAHPAVGPWAAGPIGTTSESAGPDDVLIVVSGGVGIKGTVVQTWGSGTAVTAPVDGRTAAQGG
jgi:hypothetical protein